MNPYFHNTTVGERSRVAKLTVKGVQEIRQRHADGECPGKLAIEYGVTRVHINRIARRQSWRSVN